MHACDCDRVLNIIDSYERQIYLLRKEVDGDGELTVRSESILSDDRCTPNFKALIRVNNKLCIINKDIIAFTEY